MRTDTNIGYNIRSGMASVIELRIQGIELESINWFASMSSAEA